MTERRRERRVRWGVDRDVAPADPSSRAADRANPKERRALDLQQTVGNRATNVWAVQRMFRGAELGFEDIKFAGKEQGPQEDKAPWKGDAFEEKTEPGWSNPVELDEAGKVPWKESPAEEDTKLPWKDGPGEVETKMPWKDDPGELDTKMPWKQELGEADTKMPWEQDQGEVDTKAPWKDESGTGSKDKGWW